MKTFKFLTEPNSNDDLLDFIVYLCNFCNWNHDNISSLNLTGVHVVDWGSFFLLNQSWGTNDSTKLKFRFHQNNGDIYTIKVQKDYDWHQHQYTDYYVPQGGIRFNNSPQRIFIENENYNNGTTIQ